jgi:hypothetical protein
VTYLYGMKVLFFVAALLATFTVSAQKRKCGTADNLKQAMLDNPAVAAAVKAMEVQIALEDAQPIKKTRAATITIPVVVHVIHNGVAVGTGRNISDARIFSQIDAMQEDFQKKNSDSLPTSHPFYSATGNAKIDFVLARRDPNGLTTTGIIRQTVNSPLNATKLKESEIEASVKPSTIWDRSKYLNIWVVDFDENDAGTGNILGYAQFPNSGAANTDGVVIDYKYFGVGLGSVAPYNNGRTAVHEVGHWLGLYHIWGDDDDDDGVCDAGECGGTDFVTDTRNGCERNYGAPSFPNKGGQCGNDANGDMYMNYMDYSDDNAMRMFTQGQADRMNQFLNATGTPRNQLFSSLGGQWPTALQNQNIELAKIYPNPATATITLVFAKQNEAATVTVCDLFGKVVVPNTQINNTSSLHNLDISHLSVGQYVVRIQQGAQLSVSKFVKQ